MLRTIIKSVKIGDLPEGKREEWANHLVKDLVRAKRNGDPIQNLKNIVRHAVEEIIEITVMTQRK